MSTLLLLLSVCFHPADDPPIAEAATSAAVKVSRAKATDGDTIAVEVDHWPEPFRKIGVRVRGIDTPERKGKTKAERDNAEKARAAVAGMLAGKDVKLRRIGRDKYFRLLADVEAGGKDVAASLIALGFARPYDGGKKAEWTLRGLAQEPDRATLSVATSAQQSAPLVVNGDNQPALQAFVNSLPEGSTVTLPAGIWHVHSKLRLKAGQGLVGKGMDQTIIRSVGTAWTDGVIVWGVDWTNPAHGVRLSDLTVEQTVNGPTQHTCIHGEGNDSKLTRVRVRGSRYEGIVIGGWNVVADLTDCVAEDCGNGGVAYALSTAGFNSHAFKTRYTRCVATRCGQGFEFGSAETIVDGCLVIEPGVGKPNIAYNIGSYVNGVWKVRLRNSRSVKYEQAVSIGNGIGRLSNVRIEGNTFVDGSINFMGGKPVNVVPHPHTGFEGPDVYGSAAVGNTFIFTKSNYGAISYNTGPSASWEVFGREHFTIERNVSHFRLAAGDAQHAPVYGFAGKITGKCKLVDNLVCGLPAAPGRGDAASYTNNDNPAVPNMPIFVKGNVATNEAGIERPFVVKIEGAPAP